MGLRYVVYKVAVINGCIALREKHTKYTGSSPGLTANMFFENIEIIELTPILKQ